MGRDLLLHFCPLIDCLSSELTTLAMPKKPRSIRGRQNYLSGLQKKLACKEAPRTDEEPQPATPSQVADTSTSQPLTLPEEGVIDLPDAEEYGKEVRSKVDERKRLLASVTARDESAAKDEKDKDASSNIVISVSRLKDLFLKESTWCENCRTTSHNIKLKPRGADVDVSVVCETCGAVLYCDPAPKIGKYNENTLSMVYNSITSGGMYTWYRNIALALRTKPLHEKAYYEIRDFLGERIIAYWKATAETIRKAVVRKYEELGIFPDENGVLNVQVSYGTWLTSGHSSHIGVGFVVEIYTGYVLDVEVMSTYCVQCARLTTKKRTKAIGNTKFREARGKHKANCVRNFDGRSATMVKEAAKKMWARSEGQNRMRYEVLVGDRNAVTFAALQEMNDDTGPYDIPIINENCVDHVGRRLGTGLRKHRLTEHEIEKLTGYFTDAIRGHEGKGVSSVYKDILASYLHCSSSDEHPNHCYCPTGEDSWCFFNRAKAKGEPPTPHKDMELHLEVDQKTRKEILNIYRDLSNDDMLQKCLKGKTQNINEALHSKVQNHLHKKKFYGLKSCKISAVLTVLEHNLGYVAASLDNILGRDLSSPGMEAHLERKERRRVAGSAPARKASPAKKRKLSGDRN